MGNDNPLALPFPAAAKTGTTNDFRDNWTMGYTPGLVVGVWTGNTDNSEMLNISGLTGAAPLWRDFMQAVYSDFVCWNRST
jgi:membrane peptidoglycan carboxypeptidase